MKAGVVHAKNDIRWEEIDKPTAAPGKVLIKVKYTGICGSDVPRVNGDACHYYPNVLGHEFSGVVEEIEPEKNQVSVMVSMFGRETPVELELDQVEVLA